MGCLKLNTEPEYNALSVPDKLGKDVFGAASKSSRGSEKNGVETGYYYFGARYYDPRTSTWLSVDPLASKYPHASPYNYCLGNPIRLSDIDGRDIIIKQMKGDERNSAERTFIHLQGLTSDKLSFNRKTGEITIDKGIGNAKATAEGTQLVRDLITDHSKQTTITNDQKAISIDLKSNAAAIPLNKENAINGTGTNTTIYFSPDIEAQFTDNNCNEQKSTPGRVLSHELIHANHNRLGQNERKLDPVGGGLEKIYTKEEQNTIMQENKIYEIQRYDGTNGP